jgi:hypothetical protein
MLEADQGSAIVVQARVVHGRLMTGDLEVLYVTGFAFTPEQPHTSPNAIRTLVENARIVSDSHPEGAARLKGAERRREPRLDVLGELHGFIETLGLPLIVRDLSLGGCSIETHKPLESGSTQFVRIDVYDSLSVTLQARVAHSSRAATSAACSSSTPIAIRSASSSASCGRRSDSDRLPVSSSDGSRRRLRRD